MGHAQDSALGAGAYLSPAPTANLLQDRVSDARDGTHSPPANAATGKSQHVTPGARGWDQTIPTTENLGFDADMVEKTVAFPAFCTTAAHDVPRPGSVCPIAVHKSLAIQEVVSQGSLCTTSWLYMIV
jgi:hypothetical protein